MPRCTSGGSLVSALMVSEQQLSRHQADDQRSTSQTAHKEVDRSLLVRIKDRVVEVPPDVLWE